MFIKDMKWTLIVDSKKDEDLLKKVYRNVELVKENNLSKVIKADKQFLKKYSTPKLIHDDFMTDRVEEILFRIEEYEPEPEPEPKKEIKPQNSIEEMLAKESKSGKTQLKDEAPPKEKPAPVVDENLMNRMRNMAAIKKKETNEREEL